MESVLLVPSAMKVKYAQTTSLVTESVYQESVWLLSHQHQQRHHYLVLTAISPQISPRLQQFWPLSQAPPLLNPYPPPQFLSLVLLLWLSHAYRLCLGLHAMLVSVDFRVSVLMAFAILALLSLMVLLARWASVTLEFVWLRPPPQ